MLKKTLLQAAALLLVSSILAAFRSFAPGSIPWSGSWPDPNSNAEESYRAVAEPGDPAFISLSELQSALDQPDLLILDARKHEDFVQGRIPGARSLPFYALDEFSASALADTTAETPIIVYCEGVGCELSLFLGRELMNSGFNDVKVFYGGWPEWSQAGLPVEKGDETSE